MFFKYNIYTIIWAILILILTLSPGSVMPEDERLYFPLSDKIAHFFVFCVFAYLLANGFKRQYTFKILKKHAFFISFIIATFFGISIEVIQDNIPGRGFDFLDIFANISGITIGLFFFKVNYKN